MKLIKKQKRWLRTLRQANTRYWKWFLHDIYRSWKMANHKAIEQEDRKNHPTSTVLQDIFDQHDDWDLAKRIADDAVEEPFDPEECVTVDEDTRAMMDAEWEAERERWEEEREHKELVDYLDDKISEATTIPKSFWTTPKE